MRFSICGTLILFLVAGAAFAQQAAPNSAQGDPLAAAARQAREQKKQQPKSPRVWDNDNIPKNPGTLSIVGEPATQESASTAGPQPGAVTGDDKAAPATKAPESPADKKKALESELAAAKETLQNLQNDLDILQHKLALDQQMYYSKPEYSTDKAGAAALADEQSQVDAKHVEMGAAQQKVAGLQAQLNALSEAKPSEN